MSSTLEGLARAVEATKAKGLTTLDEQVNYAHILVAFATELQHQQYFQDGEQASAAAVDIFIRAIEAGQEKYSPRLADSLRVQANCLHGSRNPRAIKVFGSAARLFGLLAKQDPQFYVPKLAGVSDDLGCALREQGRTQEALVHAEKAVETFGLVEDGWAEASEHHFATARLNLAKVYTALGRHDDALKQAREGVQMFEALAQGSPYHFGLIHAQAMDDLSLTLAGAGKIDEAIAQAERAAERVAEVAGRTLEPDSVAPLVARLANNLGQRYCKAGRFEDALAPARKAVEGFDVLIRQNRAGFIGHAVRIRNNLVVILEKLERMDEAYAINAETVELAREVDRELQFDVVRKQAWLASQLGRPTSEMLELAIHGLRTIEPLWRAEPERLAKMVQRLAADIIDFATNTDTEVPDDIVALLEEVAT